MKKVLFVAGGYPEPKRRNNFTFSHELVKALSDNRTDIAVLNTKSSQHRLLEQEIYDGINVYRCNIKVYKRNPFRYFFDLALLYKQFGEIAKEYDNVIFSFIYPSFYPLLPLFRGKYKMLITHGGDAMMRWDNPLKRAVKRRFLSKMDRYLAVSDMTSVYLEHFVPKKKVKSISVLYNGINKSKFLECRDKKTIRRFLEIESDTFVLLTVCHLVSRKGVDILLEADRQLMNNGVKFKHIIVGKGHEEAMLKDFVLKNDLGKNIEFISYIKEDKDLAELFVASDLYVMMSKTEHEKTAMEGFGIVYAEAQYAGVPVIAGKSGGVFSAMRDSFTGYLVDPDQADASSQVAAHIEELYKNKEKYHFFSQNAKKFVEENLDWNLYAKRIIQYLK